MPKSSFDRQPTLEKVLKGLAVDGLDRLDKISAKIQQEGKLSAIKGHEQFEFIATAFRDEIYDCLSKIPSEVTRVMAGSKIKGTAQVREVALRGYEELRNTLVDAAQGKLRAVSLRLGYSEPPHFNLEQGLQHRVVPNLDLAIDKLEPSIWSRLDVPVKVIGGLITIVTLLIGGVWQVVQWSNAAKRKLPNGATAASRASPFPEPRAQIPNPSIIPTAPPSVPVANPSAFLSPAVPTATGSASVAAETPVNLDDEEAIETMLLGRWSGKIKTDEGLAEYHFEFFRNGYGKLYGRYDYRDLDFAFYKEIYWQVRSRKLKTDDVSKELENRVMDPTALAAMKQAFAPERAIVAISHDNLVFDVDGLTLRMQLE